MGKKTAKRKKNHTAQSVRVLFSNPVHPGFGTKQFSRGSPLLTANSLQNIQFFCTCTHKPVHPNLPYITPFVLTFLFYVKCVISERWGKLFTVGCICFLSGHTLGFFWFFYKMWAFSAICCPQLVLSFSVPVDRQVFMGVKWIQIIFFLYFCHYTIVYAYINILSFFKYCMSQTTKTRSWHGISATAGVLHNINTICPCTL